MLYISIYLLPGIVCPEPCFVFAIFRKTHQGLYQTVVYMRKYPYLALWGKGSYYRWIRPNSRKRILSAEWETPHFAAVPCRSPRTTSRFFFEHQILRQ